MIPGREAVSYAKSKNKACIAVFGKGWGGELRLPQKLGSGGYFIDWVLGKLDVTGKLEEFVAVEVQAIDTTGNYRNGFMALKSNRSITKTTAGLNWENVSKRIFLSSSIKGRFCNEKRCVQEGVVFRLP